MKMAGPVCAIQLLDFVFPGKVSRAIVISFIPVLWFLNISEVPCVKGLVLNSVPLRCGTWRKALRPLGIVGTPDLRVSPVDQLQSPAMMWHCHRLKAGGCELKPGGHDEP